MNRQELEHELNLALRPSKDPLSGPSREWIAERFGLTNEGFVDLRKLTLWDVFGVEWSRVDLSGVTLIFGKIEGQMRTASGCLGSIRSRFCDCIMSRIRVRDRNVEGKYERCRFDRAILTSADFWGQFDSCVFENANMSSCRMNGTPSDQWKFLDCDFTGANFKRCNVTAVVFGRCDFTDVKWQKGAFAGCRLRDCKIDFDAMVAADVFLEHTRRE